MDPSHPDYAYNQITHAVGKLAGNLVGLVLLGVAIFWVFVGLMALLPGPLAGCDAGGGERPTCSATYTDECCR